MHLKKRLLIFALIVFTATLAYCLGSINFFGLVESSTSSHLILLLSAVVVTYLISITIFLLDFSDQHHLIMLYTVLSLLFGSIVFLLHMHLASSLAIAVFFFMMVMYTYKKSASRSKLFVSFRANEIFQPVVKISFMWLIIIFATVSFKETEILTKENSLVSRLLTISINHIAPIFNKQLNAQLSNYLKSLPPLPDNGKEQLIQQALGQITSSLSREDTRSWIGMDPDDIPVNRAQIASDGSVDIKPVLHAMIPTTSRHLTQKYSAFIGFAPLAIAFISVIILQSLLWPFHLIAGFFTPMVFFILTVTGFIKKASEVVEVERMVL